MREIFSWKQAKCGLSRKGIKFAGLCLGLLVLLSLFSAQVSYAAPVRDSGVETSAAGTNTPDPTARCVNTFLGLKPWYHYLKLNTNCDITGFRIFPTDTSSSDIPLVALAVVDDLLRIAGLAALIFVLYGAVRYIASQGNPEETAKAQSTIINALIGLAIATVAVGVVSFLGNKIT